MSEGVLMQSTRSTQSYGLADRLLSQAAIMVMAVGGKPGLQVHTP